MPARTDGPGVGDHAHGEAARGRELRGERGDALRVVDDPVVLR